MIEGTSIRGDFGADDDKSGLEGALLWSGSSLLTADLTGGQLASPERQLESPVGLEAPLRSKYSQA